MPRKGVEIFFSRDERTPRDIEQHWEVVGMLMLGNARKMPGDNGLHGNFNIKNTEIFWEALRKKITNNGGILRDDQTLNKTRKMRGHKVK